MPIQGAPISYKPGEFILLGKNVPARTASTKARALQGHNTIIAMTMTNLSYLLVAYTHYSKSPIFIQKFNFDKTPTFSRVFHPNFFWTIFLVKSKLSTVKKSKTKTFSRVFHPNFFWQFFSWNQSCQQLKSPKPKHFHEFSLKTIRQFFSVYQSWIFGQKNEVFEQCEVPTLKKNYSWKDILKLFRPGHWLGISSWTRWPSSFCFTDQRA